MYSSWHMRSAFFRSRTDSGIILCKYCQKLSFVWKHKKVDVRAILMSGLEFRLLSGLWAAINFPEIEFFRIYPEFFLKNLGRWRHCYLIKMTSSFSFFGNSLSLFLKLPRFRVFSLSLSFFSLEFFSKTPKF